MDKKLVDQVEMALDVADNQAKTTSERLAHSQVFSKLRETVRG